MLRQEKIKESEQKAVGEGKKIIEGIKITVSRKSDSQVPESEKAK